MRYLFFLFLCVSALFGAKMAEAESVYAVPSGIVTDILYSDAKLYVATESGKIEVFDTRTKKRIETVSLGKIEDFMGDEVDSKIFSIDRIGGTLLILSQDSGGYSRIHLFRDGKLVELNGRGDRLNIVQAKFIDEKTVLLALISDDIIAYDIAGKKRKWTVQASMSKFSSFALDNDRRRVAVADESGEVHLLSTGDGKTVRVLKGQNVDNIFGIDFKGDIVLTGGQDRRAAVYDVRSGTAYYRMSDFFVYGVGLSPSGKIAAYSSDINNNVTLFDTKTRVEVGKYKSNAAIVNGIVFVDENAFFVNTSSHEVRYYKVR